MPGWRREAEALIVEMLGTPAACWVEWNEALPAEGSAVPHLVLSMVGHTASSADRIQMLARIGEVLAAEGILVVIDHNRPRRMWAALAAVVGAPRAAGVWPATRWRRLGHPTAREVQGAGFRVDRLRFAAGERLQIVIAACTGSSASRPRTWRRGARE